MARSPLFPNPDAADPENSTEPQDVRPPNDLPPWHREVPHLERRQTPAY